ncbi:MAG: M16 family metallopeptidase [Bacteroidota bacterium]
MPDRTIPPKFHNIDDIVLRIPRREQFSNGTPLMINAMDEGRVVKIDIVLQAGSWFESKPFVAELTNEMITEGTSTFSSRDIKEKLDFYGAYLKTDINHDVATVSLITLTHFLDQTLKILANVLTEPAFPDEYLEIIKQNHVQRFYHDMQKVKVLAKRRFLETLYGSQHPYGRQINVEDILAVNRQDIVQFFDHFYVQGNWQIIVSGNVKPDLISKLEVYFGKRPQYPVRERKRFAQNGAQPGIKEQVFKPNALQAGLRTGRVLFNRRHADYPKMLLLNTLLGGFFGSRLMKNIREDKGYTYGIGSTIFSFKESGYFVILSEVGSDVIEPAVEEIFKEIRILQTENVKDEELELVRNYLLGTLMRRFDGVFAIADSSKLMIEFDLEDDYYSRLIDVIKATTAEDINVLAGKYLSEDELITVIAGNNQ